MRENEQAAAPPPTPSLAQDVSQTRLTLLLGGGGHLHPERHDSGDGGLAKLLNIICVYKICIEKGRMSERLETILSEGIQAAPQG